MAIRNTMFSFSLTDFHLWKKKKKEEIDETEVSGIIINFINPVFIGGS